MNNLIVKTALEKKFEDLRNFAKIVFQSDGRLCDRGREAGREGREVGDEGAGNGEKRGSSTPTTSATRVEF